MKIDNHFIVYDVETGGLSPSKNPITEIGVIVLNPDLEEVYSYGSFIRGYDNLEHNPEALRLTGITHQDISSGISKEELAKEFRRIVKQFTMKGRTGKPILCGHNSIDFDAGFIKYVIPDLYDIVNSFQLDTLWLSRLAWGRDDSMVDFKLGTCCDRLGISLVGAHRAVNDARATSKLLSHHLSTSRNGTATISTETRATKQRVSFRF